MHNNTDALYNVTAAVCSYRGEKMGDAIFEFMQKKKKEILLSFFPITWFLIKGQRYCQLFVL